MVTKMEKFTQKEYEDLRTILTDINMHPGIIVYKDDEENKILEKLYNWFENNTYGFIEYIASEDRIVENIFHKIYLLVKNIKDSRLTDSGYKLSIDNLNDCYNKIENIAKSYKLNNEEREKILKESIDKFFNYINLSQNDIKVLINKLDDKIKQYNIQADNTSNDLADHKKEALADIERKRKEFTKLIDDYIKDVEVTKDNLIQQYDDLNEYHKNFENKIYKELNDIQNSVNREQLAAYFLNERKKLKGDIDIPILICTFLFECIYFLKIDCYITASWHQFIFLRICILAIGIFILFLSVAQLVKFLYSRYIEKNNEVTIKPFEELKALLTPYWCWLGLTFIGMGCIAKVAHDLYYVNSTKIDHLDPYLLLANLPIFMILVWFTWFSSK